MRVTSIEMNEPQSGHDTLSKKPAKGGDKAVDVFRGVSFSDWLRLFMQVGYIYVWHDLVLTVVEVLFHSDKKRAI